MPIACAGHWVIDFIKFIDNWPKKAELCNITSELISNGGAPFNIIVDLANLQTGIKTYGIGCIGNDPFTHYLLQICKEKNINIDYLKTLKGESTSYTDVMTTVKTGIRTMFHFHGANRKFAPQHVPIKELKKKKVKLFYLGHLLLMDALEEKDDEYGLAVCRLLHDVQQAGMETVVDIATERQAQRYQDIVVPTLPYIDHFVINELEAQKTADIKIREPHGTISLDGIRKAANFLLDNGVKKNVVIHMPEGAYWLNKAKKGIWYPSFVIPPNLFRATCGAGDAFCSGILAGLYKKWEREKTLLLATAASAASISSPHNSDGIQPIKETMQMAKKYILRESIVYD